MKVTTLLKGEMRDITWFQSVIRGAQLGLGSATEKECEIIRIFRKFCGEKKCCVPLPADRSQRYYWRFGSTQKYHPTINQSNNWRASGKKMAIFLEDQLDRQADDGANIQFWWSVRKNTKPTLLSWFPLRPNDPQLKLFADQQYRTTHKRAQIQFSGGGGGCQTQF